jgi:hypothetical protein
LWIDRKQPTGERKWWGLRKVIAPPDGRIQQNELRPLFPASKPEVTDVGSHKAILHDLTATDASPHSAVQIRAQYLITELPGYDTSAV